MRLAPLPRNVDPHRRWLPRPDPVRGLPIPECRQLAHALLPFLEAHLRSPRPERALHTRRECLAIRLLADLKNSSPEGAAREAHLLLQFRHGAGSHQVPSFDTALRAVHTLSPERIHRDLQGVLDAQIALAREEGCFASEESRIMPDRANRGSFVQAYNCQAMVDGKAQIIVAAEATQAPQDQQQMVPMVNASIRNTGVIPQELVADAGYFSEAAIREVEERGIDVYCPPDNGRRTERGACPLGRPPLEETCVQRMRRKVRSEVGRAHYRYRKFVVEPVFGQIKQGRGLRQFLLRGFGKVQGEWQLWALTHNLRKFHLPWVA